MWSSQRYISEGRRRGSPDEVLNAAVEQIEQVTDAGLGLPALLSLNHLALRTSVPHKFLRGVVRRADINAYRKFSIRKRSGGRRFLHVPSPYLGTVQRWIHEHILKTVGVHSCSHAFRPKSSIYKCANKHSGAQWLIKMDITGFFESISEIQVCRVFKSLGYQPLVAFELARIATISPGMLGPRKHNRAWRINKRNKSIPAYSADVLGYLPQGAPTSPLLSNLVMREIDKDIQQAAKLVGLTFTRYSDDLTFSRRDKNFSRKHAREFINTVGKILSASGFRPQHRKTVVIPPGSRKIVLGLQVDGDTPRLRKEFKDLLRQHIYYLKKFGPIEHANVRKFESVWGMKCHIRGLIDYANMVEPEYAGALLERFDALDWPV